MMLWRVLTDVGFAAGAAAFVTHCLVPPVGRLAYLLQAVDEPGGRRAHASARPRLGGLAMVAGTVFGFSVMALMRWQVWQPRIDPKELGTLVVASFLVVLIGVVDDITGMSAARKLLGQGVAAVLIVAGGWKFTLLGIPGGGEIELGAWGGLLTVVWVVGITNAINLLDGLDGLAAGVIAIIGSSFIVYSLVLGNAFGAALLAAIVGACLGFLPHNWEPARLFMGDAGSLTFGFLLGVASVHTSLKAPTAVAILVPLLALGIPVIDTTMVMATRFLERPKGRAFKRILRIFHADRNHLHHLMQSIVVRRRSVVHCIYGLVLASSVLAVVTAVTRRADLGLAVLFVEIGAVVLIRRLGFGRRAEALSLDQRATLDDPFDRAAPDGAAFEASAEGMAARSGADPASGPIPASTASASSEHVTA